MRTVSAVPTAEIQSHAAGAEAIWNRSGQTNERTWDAGGRIPSVGRRILGLQSGSSTDPIVASHSNCRELCRHPRNLTDEMLRAVGEKGGVVGLNFYSAFLS